MKSRDARALKIPTINKRKKYPDHLVMASYTNPFEAWSEACRIGDKLKDEGYDLLLYGKMCRLTYSSRKNHEMIEIEIHPTESF